MTPTLASYAKRLYQALSPIAAADQQEGFPLATYLGALGSMFQEVEDYAADGPNGETGWSIMLDIDRIPDKGLAYLAQYVGVRPNPTFSSAEQREQIRTTDGWNRGTVKSLIDALAPVLTGSKSVFVLERDTSAYHFTVVTYAAETPDEAVALSRLVSRKPAGLVMDYFTISPWNFFLVRQQYATFGSVRARFISFRDLRDNNPNFSLGILYPNTTLYPNDTQYPNS